MTKESGISRPVLELMNSPVQWALEAFCLGVKWLGA